MEGLTLSWTFWRDNPPSVNAKVLPTYGSAEAIGLDLRAAYDYSLNPGHIARVRTGIAVEIPEGFYGRIAPRSGLAAKYGVQVLAGVIDPDYRGELIVLLTTFTAIALAPGERIAQLILERAARADLKYVGALGKTERGSGGFGSTGTK